MPSTSHLNSLIRIANREKTSSQRDRFTISATEQDATSGQVHTARAAHLPLARLYCLGLGPSPSALPSRPFLNEGQQRVCEVALWCVTREIFFFPPPAPGGVTSNPSCQHIIGNPGGTWPLPPRIIYTVQSIGTKYSINQRHCCTYIFPLFKSACLRCPQHIITAVVNRTPTTTMHGVKVAGQPGEQNKTRRIQIIGITYRGNYFITIYSEGILAELFWYPPRLSSSISRDIMTRHILATIHLCILSFCRREQYPTVVYY